MWHQLLIDVFLHISPLDSSKNEMVQYCRLNYKDKPNALKVIDDFNRTYKSNDAIWWNTQDYISSLLNNILNSNDIQLMFKFHSYIIDLNNQLCQIHSQFIQNLLVNQKIVTVYLGQVMSRENLKHLKNNIGGLMMIKHFLMTTRNREMALIFAGYGSEMTQGESVLFHITINIHTIKKPFAPIKHMVNMSDSEEIMLSMASVFCIESVEQSDNRVWCIRLKLINDEDVQVKELATFIKKEINTTVPTLIIGKILVMMDDYDSADRYYKMLLSTNNHSLKGAIHTNLGIVNNEKGMYSEAQKQFLEALTIETKCIPPNYPNQAAIYTNLGTIFEKNNNNTEALQYYEKAREMALKSPQSDLLLASIHNNIGTIYKNMGDYPKAMDNFSKAYQL
ncbi:unnamed protein product [Didymodactylos carnosus]|uniref:Uncharacterized protein n=2 Tax=Didymodactylos carnosus TaxID=1234261 RepID=A0A813VI84_9BILA|nr:unnamed protein product [Didymodactylos carnosus]CAF3630882.1 unnamed protein product [Didymodactylos carnosus]